MRDEGTNTILAVDKDATVHDRETAEWTKHGIDALRFDTMTEAIIILTHRDDFLFVAINEDTIPDFISQIRIMRGVTNLPIFVITSNYTIDKKLIAMNNGADVYDHFDAYIKKNVIVALTMLKAQKKWPKRLPKSLRTLTDGDMVISPLQRSAFIKDVKIPLTKKEFDIVQCLMSNDGNIVTHARLIRKVWGDKYNLSDTVLLYPTIDRLRRKLSEISPTTEYIEIERGIGYKFSVSKR